MGPGSLHQAVADAWAHADAQSTITFDQPLDGQTITLTAFSNGLGCVTSNATTCSDGGTLSQQFGPSAFFITGGKTLTIPFLYSANVAGVSKAFFRIKV